MNHSLQFCQKLSQSNILLIEDDIDTQVLFRFILEECEAKVTTVTTIAEAKEVLVKTSVDLIISNIRLPDGDAYSLIQELIQEKQNQGEEFTTPVIAVTALARKSDREKALISGFWVHIAKPIDPYMLIQVAAEVITDHQS